MEVVSVTSKTQFIFKLALSEIFIPKSDIQFITTTVEIKKIQ